MATEIKVVLPDGSLKHLIRNKDSEFFYFLHGFGGLGVIYEITISLLDSFNVYKSIY